MLNYKTPQEMTDYYLSAGVKKAKTSNFDLLIMGLMAGMFIALGANASVVAMHGVHDYGLAKLVAGTVFPVGLILIVVTGMELFTGDCLMIFGVLDKKFTVANMARALTVIFLSNCIGAFITALLVLYSGQLNMSYGALGAHTINTAYTKSTISFSTAITSGILCNILVCAAVLVGAAAKDISGKILGIYITIFAFVITGFEHCIANAYYGSIGILASSNEKYRAQAMEIYHLTVEQLDSLSFGNFIVSNIIPVTIGNIIGGMLFVGLPLYYLHIQREKNK